MSELDRVELRPAGDGEGKGSRIGRGPGGGGWLYGLAAVVLLVVLGIAGYCYLRTEPESTPPEPMAEFPPSAPPPEVVEDTAEPLVLPALDASDEVVRTLVAGLSARPELARWLVHDQLIRRFVVVVDNVAEGVSPRGHVEFLAPGDEIQVLEAGDDSLLLDEASYRRYDPLAAVVASLDTEGTVHLYRSLRPLIDEAYRDLGYPDRPFDETLEEAVASLLAVPVVTGAVRLEAGVVSYRYADPRLEDLTAAQKHLLRMGPDNTRRIQGKLRDLARALGIPAERLPTSAGG